MQTQTNESTGLDEQSAPTEELHLNNVDGMRDEEAQLGKDYIATAVGMVCWEKHQPVSYTVEGSGVPG